MGKQYAMVRMEKKMNLENISRKNSPSPIVSGKRIQNFQK